MLRGCGLVRATVAEGLAFEQQVQEPRRKATMIVKFIVVKGQDAGKSFSLKDGETRIIGRSTKSDVQVRDPGISRLHCQITCDGQRCVITDMNSKNGTFVNGQRIAGETELHSADSVGIGTTVLQVEIMSEALHPRPTVRTPKPPPLPAIETLEAPPAPAVSSVPQRDASAEELLGSFERWLEQAPPQSAPPSDAAPEPEVHVELASPTGGDEATDRYLGRVLGGFLVEERQGTDLLSVSYRATQLSMERPVLLRILKDSMTKNASAVQRFLDAASAAGRLVHPHILQVYDAGRADDTYYIAMEYIEGKNINQLLTEGGVGRPLPTRRALEIGVQIAGALDYAHAQQVIHGRITPAVIFVTGHGIAKLAELGFARALQDAGLDIEEAPARRAVISQFVAPEQLREPPLADARTDIYSLGVVLYLMLAGRLPFAAKGDTLRARIAVGQAEPLQRANPALPEAVCTAVARAMAPEPAKRYARAGELQAALSYVLSHHPEF